MADKTLEWTKDQEAAITASGDNILVSAAAGSGKTAVLVERVIRMLTRPEDPVELDRLLIMTFTRAAAAQMREKISAALRAKLEKDPADENIRRQLMKIHTAHIGTIDSLCADIVRENFQDIDLDPGFRFADEAEIKLLKQDVLADILEQYYSGEDDRFFGLVDYFIDRNDSKLEDVIQTLYTFAESHPEPLIWLKECIYPYTGAEAVCRGEEPPDGYDLWMPALGKMIDSEFDEIRSMAQTGIRIACANHGPFKYEEPFNEIITFIDSLEGQCWDYRKDAIEKHLLEWKRSPTISKKDDVDEDLKQFASSLRKEIKKKLATIADTYFYRTLDGMYADMAACAPVARMIAELATEFATAFENIKKEKKIADFSDIAHYALSVLICFDEEGRIRRDDSGKIIYTRTADRMALSYDEIIVDEYQDTNLLQEYLIGALSGERFGRPDVFMVGDVKQSIYGFRMACPGLFINKYDNYKYGIGGKLIVLNKNFRSRTEILDVTNDVFDKTMIRDIGGIEYTDGHALAYGEGFDKDLTGQYKTEMFFIEGGGEKAKQSEAYLIAARIEKLVAEGKFDYSDMVILSRTTDNLAIEKMLSARGIPLIKSSKKGFFDSMEIRLACDLFAVVDNPYQDIPLASVLMSPVCGFSANEMAALRLASEDNNSPLFECLKAIAQEDADNGNNYISSLKERAGWLLESIKRWQFLKVTLELTELIDRVLSESGLYLILAAMPDGESKKANIDFLKERAASFSNGPYTGLFHFIRYIKQIQEASVDYGQADTVSEDANAVRMMTVHGSKGLEFPVVFLVNCGKDQNKNDIRGSIIPDREMGLGLEYRDLDRRVIKRTLHMETIRHKKLKDSFAEEMRLLYVAMTRAKEKLIVTGTDRYLLKYMETAALDHPEPGSHIKGFKILSASSWLRLLSLALYYENGKYADICCMETDDVLTLRAEEEAVNETDKNSILSMSSDDTDISELTEEMNYLYPFRKATQIQAKISPSQLETDTDKARHENDDEELKLKAAYAPGIERGNAYHRFLELFDYSRPDEIAAQLDEMTSSGKLAAGYAEYIEPGKIERFLSSGLGHRMKKAFKAEKLYREQPFLMGVPTDINNETTVTGPAAVSDIPDNEILLVQGVIDAYFEEDDKVILVDYKTDRNVDEETLAARYSGQQNSYADALKKIYGKEVSEMYLYSLFLDKEVKL